MHYNLQNKLNLLLALLIVINKFNMKFQICYFCKKNVEKNEKKRKAKYIIQKLIGKFDYVVELKLYEYENDIELVNLNRFNDIRKMYYDDNKSFRYIIYSDLVKVTNYSKKMKKILDYRLEERININETYDKIIEIEKTTDFKNSDFEHFDIIYLELND